MRTCVRVSAWVRRRAHMFIHTHQKQPTGAAYNDRNFNASTRDCAPRGAMFFFFLLSILFVSFFFKCLWSRFFYGKRQGLGVMQYADGSVYTGWWACSFYPWHETCFSLFFSSVFFASSWKTPSFPLFVFPATISICCLPLKINFLVFIGTKTTLGPGMGSYRAQTALP